MLNKIYDFKILLGEMVESPEEETRSHAKTLFGPRTRGSVTENGIDAIPNDREAVEFVPTVGAIPVCKYYKVHAPEVKGRLGAVSLAEAESMGWDVKERDGSHGLELYRDVDVQDAEMPSCDDITIIVGPDEGSMESIIWTWHPGLPLGSLKDGRTPDTGVKVHNG